MNPKSLWRCASLALGLVASGCAVGPDYHRPVVAMPAHFAERPGWTTAVPADQAPKGEWWRVFHDPLLDRLEPRVAMANQTVRAAYATYRQASADVVLARSQYWPAIGIDGSATRARSPGVSGRNGGVVDAATLEGTANWTPDLWGAVRRLVEQNEALAQADAALFANATLSEQILLATTVIGLRATDAAVDLQRRTVEAYRRALDITQQQAEAGVAKSPPSAVITARVALETARANLVGLGVARAQYAHAIAVLVGENPENLAIDHDGRLPDVPAVPVGLPSTLLQRRPDVAAAERTMAAQNAAIGVTVAAYYPNLSLSAADGFTQSPLTGLLHAANSVWSLGASGAETLFDFGGRRARVRAARAAYDAAVANYRSTVLNALERLENDLSGLRILGRQAGALDVAVRDAKRGTAIALAEYEAGTVDYTTVAQAQAVQLADQQSALNVAQARLDDAVALIGDLGGGWSADQLGRTR
ncbi:MAG: efflux transporter outer membrane subunit [Gammaproteobacteria bacterium]|nr:efflux transporter outer membrane subunit [Gammaproteobacteria bacterium]